jgi:hypothetical protein
MRKDSGDVIALVISGLAIAAFGLAAWFGHSSRSAEEERIAQGNDNLRAVQEKLAAREQALRRLSDVVGWKAGGVTNNRALERRLDDAADRLGEAAALPAGANKWTAGEGATGLTVKEWIEAMEKKTEELRAERASAASERDRYREQERSILGSPEAPEGSYGRMIGERDREIRGLREEIESLQSRLDENRRRGEEEAAQKEAAIRQVIEETGARQAEIDAELGALEQTKKDLAERRSNLKVRTTVARESPEADGTVLLSDPALGYVWIDLGTRDGLMKGMRFHLYALEKGGRRRPKAEIEVLRMDERHSQARILSIVDPQDPPAQGDLVSNDTFERGKPKVFVFAGRLVGRYNNEDFARKLEDLGHRVEKVVTFDTSYLVAGAGFEKDPNYDRALQLGVRIIREEELYQFMQLP